LNAQTALNDLRGGKVVGRVMLTPDGTALF
jgi:hypothetical protein